MFAEVLMIMREWLCLVSEWSHAASHNHCYLHKETGYFGEETLRACDKSCSALRDVWELSLPMVWPLMAAQVSPRLVVTLLKVGFTHPGSRGHGHLFLKCWQDCSPSFTKKTKTALNICFISFPCSFIFFFFCTGFTSSLVLYFFIIRCSDNIFQAQKIFVANHCGDAHKWFSLSVTPDVVASAQVLCNFPTSKSFHVFQCHSNLQQTALKSMEEPFLLMVQHE